MQQSPWGSSRDNEKEPLLQQTSSSKQYQRHNEQQQQQQQQQQRQQQRRNLKWLAAFVAVAVGALAWGIGRPLTLKALHRGDVEWLTKLFEWPKPEVPTAPLSTVTYDHRSLIINGKRELLFTGTIHYPRSSTAMWPVLLERSKAAGINAIDTYVFWNLHEEEEGVYDFTTGNANLTLFLDHAKELGLFVVLRIGPYVCAEWTFGGFPFWLMEKPGMELRQYNADFMHHMELFVRKTLEVVKPYLATNGGPIVLLQIENEFGAIEAENGIRGHRYISWAADLANSLNVGIPWIMCVQDNMPTVINTGNGFYSDNWISQHWKRFPDQPAFFTELWTGWFQHWTQPKFTRPAEDVAFSAARFIARGGSYVAYYMWQGGTNFGRWGSGWKTASYDYDAPMTEYGYAHTPKFAHLKALHVVCAEYADLILSREPIVTVTGTAEAHVYGEDDRSIVFLSNFHETEEATIYLNGDKYILPRWSVSIYTQTDMGLTLRYRTSDVALDAPSIDAVQVDLPHKAAEAVGTLSFAHAFSIPEPIPTVPTTNDISSDAPLEQFRTTRDKSDYLWYIRTNVSFPADYARRGLFGRAGKHSVRFTRFHDTLSAWVDGKPLANVVHHVQFGQPEGGMVQTIARGDGSAWVEVDPRVAEGDGHVLSVLSGVTGIENCCGHLERVEKGILGAVYVDEKDVTFGDGWWHRVGLWGEKAELWNPKPSQAWRPVTSVGTPMTWYRLQFSKSALKALAEKALSLGTPSTSGALLPSFSIYLGSLVKGMAYVNGNGIGRHWSAIAGKGDRCGKECGPGAFYAEKCPVGCGEKSQEWYHVPYDWVFGEDDGEFVEVVVFDEGRGDHGGVRFTALAG
ncbi:Beta-galactosidase 6 [Phlyctochytrium planicorne]|nr:Beta-galactosidase 6 [Phlyctochytrium planicorne]